MARTKGMRNNLPQCETAKQMRSVKHIANNEKTIELFGKRLSIETARASVPRSFRGQITEDFLDKMEASVDDGELGRCVRENFLNYSNVLQDCDPNVGIWDYFNAVKFITYKIMGYSVDESWKRVFPHKVEKLIKEGREKDINRYANGYNKSQIVNKIYSQTMIPSYILHHNMFEDALYTLDDMLKNGELRGMAKVKAAEVILNYTKPPEINKAEVQVTVKQSDAISDLREVAAQFARSMQEAVANGQKTVGEIIDTEVVHRELGEADA